MGRIECIQAYDRQEKMFKLSMNQLYQQRGTILYPLDNILDVNFRYLLNFCHLFLSLWMVVIENSQKDSRLPYSHCNTKLSKPSLNLFSIRWPLLTLQLSGPEAHAPLWALPSPGGHCEDENTETSFRWESGGPVRGALTACSSLLSTSSRKSGTPDFQSRDVVLPHSPSGKEGLLAWQPHSPWKSHTSAHEKPQHSQLPVSSKRLCLHHLWTASFPLTWYFGRYVWVSPLLCAWDLQGVHHTARPELHFFVFPKETHFAGKYIRPPVCLRSAPSKGRQ